MLYDEQTDMKRCGGLPPITPYERKVLAQVDGHWCNEWDGMAVSSHTMEYDSCIDFPKSQLGRIINWFYVRRFNLGWWRVVGIPDLLAGKSPYDSTNGFPRLPVDFFVSRNLVQTPEIIAAVGVEKQGIENAKQNSAAFADFVSGGQ